MVVLRKLEVSTPDVIAACPVAAPITTPAALPTMSMQNNATTSAAHSTTSAARTCWIRYGLRVRIMRIVPHPYSLPAQLPPSTGQKKGAQNDEKKSVASQALGKNILTRSSSLVP